jgi:hypothetical protein
MIDRLFLAAFTFCLLVGGTLAIGSELLVTSPSVAMNTSAHVRMVDLDRVVIVGRRLVPGATLAQTVSTETSTPRAQ